jgi:hypothetical protein
MSYRLMGRTGAVSLDIVPKGILTAACYYARAKDDDTGVLTAGAATLAWFSGASVRHVRRCLAEWVTQGWLEKVATGGGVKRTSTYLIHLDRFPKQEPLPWMRNSASASLFDEPEEFSTTVTDEAGTVSPSHPNSDTVSANSDGVSPNLYLPEEPVKAPVRARESNGNPSGNGHTPPADPEAVVRRDIQRYTKAEKDSWDLRRLVVELNRISEAKIGANDRDEEQELRVAAQRAGLTYARAMELLEA